MVNHKEVHGGNSIRYRQLELIKSELEQIKEQVIKAELPMKEKRYTAFARYIIDEWDFGSILGQKLLSLAHIYKSRL